MAPMTIMATNVPEKAEGADGAGASSSVWSAIASVSM
jgi:hypothetical protein